MKATGDDLKFQWQKNCEDIGDDSRYRGTHTNCLQIREVEKGDRGFYRCNVKNGIDQRSTREALLTISKLFITIACTFCGSKVEHMKFVKAKNKNVHLYIIYHFSSQLIPLKSLSSPEASQYLQKQTQSL